jgi:hypothetical protein
MAKMRSFHVTQVPISVLTTIWNVRTSAEAKSFVVSQFVFIFVNFSPISGGKKEDEQKPDETPKDDKKCPDGKPAVMPCSGDTECKKYKLQCAAVGSEKYCCKSKFLWMELGVNR